MPAKLLDELETAALPALQHAELVSLARDPGLTPSRILELANARGWPRRQARAARSLAMLRRDRGTKAFEAFVTLMEHVHSEKSGIEHAQEQRKMSDKQETRRQALARLTDPYARLALALKYNLTTEAQGIAAGLMADVLTGPLVHFVQDVEREQVLFDTLTGVEPVRGALHLNDKEEMARAGRYQDRICVVFPCGQDGAEVRDDQLRRVIFDLDGLIAFLGWDGEQIADFIRRVLGRIITEIDPRRMNWRYSRATTQVTRAYLPPDNDFTRSVEIWLLRTALQTGRLFELRRTALPVPIEKCAADQGEELNPIVDRFLELGWNMEQVRAEFLGLIEGVAGNCHPQSMLTLAGAKCFRWGDEDRARLLREKFLPSMWKTYFVEMRNPPEWVTVTCRRLGQFAFQTLRGADAREECFPAFRSGLVAMLSEGKATKVHLILLGFGRDWGFFYAENGQEYVEREARTYFAAILPEAFALAHASSRFGVAAALVQHFGAPACYSDRQSSAEADAFVAAELAAVPKKGKGRSAILKDIAKKRAAKYAELRQARPEEIAQVTQMALDLEQPIRLDPLSFAHLPSWSH